MDSYLLCDEVWLSTPTTTHHLDHYNDDIPPKTRIEYTASKHDSDVEFSIFFEKEEAYLPKKGFLEYLESQNLIFSRFKAIQWLIKTCTRFNLSMEALFNAANYLDRFISISHCHEWKNWMMELLSVACLTVASKFSETYFPSLNEIQMEGLDHTFEPITIQQMELILLNRLDWKLTSTTPYSCLELLMTMELDDFFKSSSLHKDLLLDRVTQLLLRTMLDYKMVECRPSVAAVSAMWCGVEEIIPSQSQAYVTHITELFNYIHKDEIVKCRNIMLETKADDILQYNYCRENSDKCPSSPVTVLLKDGIGVDEFHADLSIFKVRELDSDVRAKKRRRMDDPDQSS